MAASIIGNIEDIKEAAMSDNPKEVYVDPALQDSAIYIYIAVIIVIAMLFVPSVYKWFRRRQTDDKMSSSELRKKMQEKRFKEFSKIEHAADELKMKI